MNKQKYVKKKLISIQILMMILFKELKLYLIQPLYKSKMLLLRKILENMPILNFVRLINHILKEKFAQIVLDRFLIIHLKNVLH
jgi:hypothetical protein